jgi:putative chitinase
LITENGWPSCSADGCQWITVPGTNPPVSLQIQKGQPLAIMRAYAADYNEFVEPLRDADSASWTPTNSVATSNHLGGTAMDLNWNSHPFRVADAGYTPQMIATMRELLDFYEGTMFWSNDWVDPKDAMHHQLGYGTYGNRHTADFIARKIRADGYSTFRRGDEVSTDVVGVLAVATGLDTDRAAAILPQVRDGLAASQCTTPRRIAMWLAQIGHESDNFNATEEYADGDESTDRWKYKGRTWIQITWSYNYADFSRWCAARDLVDYPTYFLDHPQELADVRWAALGPAWYWTTQRRDINALSDAGDLDTVTRRINGGTNGIDDRRARYNRALALGDQLLALTTNPTPTDPFEELLTMDVESLSIYATPGEPLIPVVRMIQAIDANEHRELVEDWARRGDPDALSRIARTAAGLGKFTDPATIAHAKAVLANIEATNPAVLQAFLTSQKGA